MMITAHCEPHQTTGQNQPQCNNIWSSLPTPFLVLAPMEGVTDDVFRQVIAKAGRPDLFFTEFTNVSSFASEKGRANALERLKVNPSDHPIIAQIWGKNPAHFSELASALRLLGFAGCDLNFGCPDRHVNAAGGGAAMIRTPELAIQCINAAKTALDSAKSSLPLSVKTRLGYSKVDEYRNWLSLLLSQHLAALTVHLRTKKEMSKVPAHYELIPDIVALRDQISPTTKLIINGDIKDRSHALELHAKYPTIDGFMIGRGVFSNPFCFRQPVDNLQPLPTISESLNLLHLHLSLFEESGKTNFEPLKHYFKIYLRDFPGASDLRAKLMECHSVSEAEQLLNTEKLASA